MKKFTEETKTLITIIRHTEMVRARLGHISRELERRAQLHDLSKYAPDEFAGFVEINRIARTYKYGSPEYKESIKNNNAVELHYSRNSHHPEYYSGGIGDMSLFDIIEMVCDWKAASETYGQTSFEDALKIQVERFKLTTEQIYLINMIATAIA